MLKQKLASCHKHSSSKTIQNHHIMTNKRPQLKTRKTHSYYHTKRAFGTEGRFFSSYPPGQPEKGELYQAITKKLTTHPQIQNIKHFELVNESHMHSGPMYRESHFKITLVADFPSNIKTLVSKHRFINTLLADELRNIHALSLHIFNKQQWTTQWGELSPESPLCSSKLAKTENV